MTTKPTAHIIGAGLAGCEAAFQLLNLGHQVRLYEMRPSKSTEAHKTGDFAELVCSNSLKSLNFGSAPGQLKRELSHLDSLVLKAAEYAKVPAGQALAVDRAKFSEYIKKKLTSYPDFTLIPKEITEIPSEAELEITKDIWLLASGPLTSSGLAKKIDDLCGNDSRLYFYDAIAPIIAADTIDLDECFLADRYGKGDSDYLNLPLSKEQYEAFIDAVISAEKMPLHSFEDTAYFESCLPIEVMIERGRETLRFGPMKPVGLTDPKTGRRPWANIQLRKENTGATMYSMVGFQTKMKWPAQKEVFALVPGLKNAEIFRYGSVHRNTYIESPKILSPDLSFRNNPNVFLAGQITGVEGYTESSAIGLLAGRSIAAKFDSAQFVMPPATTVIGALLSHVVRGGLGKFAPMNANLGLLPSIKRSKKISKADKKQMQCDAAYESFQAWLELTTDWKVMSESRCPHGDLSST